MVLTSRQRTDYREWLQLQGYDLKLIDRRSAPMEQWYKPNGEPIATKSKSDAYHMQLYRARGWTMLAPPQVPQQFTVHWDGRRWEVINRFGTVTEVGIEKPHIHRYKGKTIGSPCRFFGCSATREIEFKHHKGGKE